MKLEDIKEPGFYWNRLDENREWSVVLVLRRYSNPEHPRYNDVFYIEKLAENRGGWVSSSGDFIGPIQQPEK